MGGRSASYEEELITARTQVTQEMSDIEKIQLFEQRKIRTAWDEDIQEWFFSIVDVCGVLTEQPDYDHAKNYWKELKFRLIKEGNESVTNCNQLKMVSPKDGKRYSTDVADMALMFRIIESIPSKKAEPFKIWMAQVAAERFGFGKYSCISQSRSIPSIKRFENCPARGTRNRLLSYLRGRLLFLLSPQLSPSSRHQ